MYEAGSFYQEAGKLYIWRRYNKTSVATRLLGCIKKMSLEN
jgi:hypothetical protein